MIKHLTPIFCSLCLSLAAKAQTDSSLVLNYADVLDSVRSQQLNCVTLSMRNKMVWTDDKTSQEFQGTMRMQKDSIVWASLGAFGIEAARVLLTPDSFRIKYPMQSEYSEKDVSYLRNWLSLPLTFTMLEQVLRGEPIDIRENAGLARVEDSVLVLYLESATLAETIKVNPINYTITQILLKDKMLQQDMAITFDGYNLLNEKPFSFKRMVEINRAGKKVVLQMDITKAQANEDLSFPFELNERYKKVE